MALQLDAGLDKLRRSRVKSDARLRVLLLSDDTDSSLIEEGSSAINEHQCKALTYLLLPCRLVEILRQNLSSPDPETRRKVPVPKTLEVKPISRVSAAGRF